MRQLTDLDSVRLRDYVRDLLHERGAAAAEVSRRRQELPFHPLLSCYRQGSDLLRDRLRRVSLDLLEETTTVPWPMENLHYLLTSIEEASVQGATEALKCVVNSGAWLEQPEGPQRQMLALRTLLGLGWLGDPNFWLRQHRGLDGAYPLLIFRALAAHDLGLAFEHLGSLAATPDQIEEILWLFPSLIEQHSLATVRERTRHVAEQLPAEVVDRIEAWFDERAYGSIAAAEASDPEAPEQAVAAETEALEPALGGAFRIYVVDRALRPVEGLGGGELVIAGEWPARCWYDPGAARTALRFRPDPLSGEPGSRLYMTGDRVIVHPGRGFMFMDGSKLEKPAAEAQPDLSKARTGAPSPARSRKPRALRVSAKPR